MVIATLVQSVVRRAHAKKLGNVEQPLLGGLKRYHLATWRLNGYRSEE